MSKQRGRERSLARPRSGAADSAPSHAHPGVTNSCTHHHLLENALQLRLHRYHRSPGSGGARRGSGKPLAPGRMEPRGGTTERKPGSLCRFLQRSAAKQSPPGSSEGPGAFSLPPHPHRKSVALAQWFRALRWTWSAGRHLLAGAGAASRLEFACSQTKWCLSRTDL